jgi:curved DNA-binding protein CbpA
MTTYRKHFYISDHAIRAQKQESCFSGSIEKKPQNYYEALGVNSTASKDEIRRAYINLSLKFHPDKNLDEDTTEQFVEIAAAYEVLILAQSRKKYDESLGKPSSGGRIIADFWASDTGRLVKLNYYSHDTLVRQNKYWIILYHNADRRSQPFREIVKEASALFHQLGEHSEVIAFADHNCRSNRTFCTEKGIDNFPYLAVYDTSHPKQMVEKFSRVELREFAPTATVLAGYANRLAAAKAVKGRVEKLKHVDDILQSKSVMLVYFHSAMSCALCPRFVDEYLNKFAGRVPDSIRVGKVNCNMYQNVCREMLGGTISDQLRLLLYRPGLPPVSLLDFANSKSLRDQGFALEIVEKMLNLFGVEVAEPADNERTTIQRAEDFARHRREQSISADTATAEDSAAGEPEVVSDLKSSKLTRTGGLMGKMLNLFGFAVTEPADTAAAEHEDTAAAESEGTVVSDLKVSESTNDVVAENTESEGTSPPDQIKATDKADMAEVEDCAVSDSD